MTRSGRMSWLLWRGTGSVFILMESKWSRLRMITILSTVTVDISVTSSYLRDEDDILLGVVQAVSSKGSDQADVIMNLLVDYDIEDQIIAVCCDTTSSNTGVFSGAIVLICTILNTPLLWFFWRRHMQAVPISHFIGSFNGEKTKAPREGAVTNSRRSGQQ